MAFDGRVISNIGVLAAIVEGGSFARAAEALGLASRCTRSTRRATCPAPRCAPSSTLFSRASRGPMARLTKGRESGGYAGRHHHGNARSSRRPAQGWSPVKGWPRRAQLELCLPFDNGAADLSNAL